MAEETKDAAVERGLRYAEAQRNLDAAVEKAGGRKKLRQELGTVSYTLLEPFSWCGKTYETINFDFNALTGDDMEAIDDELSAMGQTTGTAAYERAQYKLLAARAGGIPADMVSKLPLVDYNQIIQAARAFLSISR